MSPQQEKKFDLEPELVHVREVSNVGKVGGRSSIKGRVYKHASNIAVGYSKANLDHMIDQARKTGKMHLNNMNLKLPLPDEIFDLRKNILKYYDGTMDGTNEQFWSCYGEEMLTTLDLSDNELSHDQNETTTLSNSISILDERIGCYKALENLFIRNCNLDDLPWKTMRKNLVALKVLDARGNKFTQVPLKDLPPSIRKLLLADNHTIQTLGNYYDCIDLPHLQHLDTSNSSLTLLPSELKCPRLERLILAKNQIEYISPGLLDSIQSCLKILDLSGNKISSSLDLSQHCNLQILELRHNKLKDAPRIHCNLMHLGLSFNEVSSIENLFAGQMDDNVKSLQDEGHEWFRSKLTEVHLEQNRLDKTLHAPTLAAMTNLKLLDVSHNALETIPHVVGYLPHLNKVLLDGNPFRMIRSAISYKKNGGIDTDRLLKSLRCKGDAPMGPGYYGSVYEGIEEKKARMMPQAVTEARNILKHASCNDQVLNIGGRGLSGELDWPELVAELNAIVKDVTSSSDLHPMTRGSQVRTWVFSNGKLSTFGDIWIQALPNITALEGKRNQIETLPDSFSQLFLKTLGLSQNRITSSTLQDSICIPGSNLASSLVHLDLSNNQIEYIPESLFEFSRLTSLNLSFNKIKTLEWKQDSNNNKTSSVGWRHGLISLEHLDLSNNAIHDLGYLPLALSGCKYLRSLLLNNNAIYHIPLELGLLEQLTNIDLLGNSQREIRVRVLTQSCSKILQYLRERMTPEEVEEARENHREIELALQHEVNQPDNGFVGEDKVQKEVLNEDDDDDDETLVCHSNDDSNTSSNDGNRYSNNHEIKSLEKVSKTTTTITNNNNDTGRSRGEKERLLVDDNDDELLLLQRISELKQNIAELSSKLENLSMSQSQRTTLKKELAMKRSKLLREQRKKDERGER
jgi:Leucine-rich repeat (LRR) protein